MDLTASRGIRPGLDKESSLLEEVKRVYDLTFVGKIPVMVFHLSGFQTKISPPKVDLHKIPFPKWRLSLFQ